MRLKMLFAMLAGLLLIASATPEPAHAIGGWFDHDKRRLPRSERGNRVVEHWLRHPRSRYPYRLHTAEDPYAYRYDARGYYPYYGAGYWRPRHTQVGRYRDGVEKPPYYAAWGYGSRRCWRRGRSDHHRRAYVRVRCHARR